MMIEKKLFVAAGSNLFYVLVGLGSWDISLLLKFKRVMFRKIVRRVLRAILLSVP